MSGASVDWPEPGRSREGPNRGPGPTRTQHTHAQSNNCNTYNILNPLSPGLAACNSRCRHSVSCGGQHVARSGRQPHAAPGGWLWTRGAALGTVTAAAATQTPCTTRRTASIHEAVFSTEPARCLHLMALLAVAPEDPGPGQTKVIVCARQSYGRVVVAALRRLKRSDAKTGWRQRACLQGVAAQRPAPYCTKLWGGGRPAGERAGQGRRPRWGGDSKSTEVCGDQPKQSGGNCGGEVCVYL